MFGLLKARLYALECGARELVGRFERVNHVTKDRMDRLEETCDELLKLMCNQQTAQRVVGNRLELLDELVDLLGYNYDSSEVGWKGWQDQIDADQNADISDDDDDYGFCEYCGGDGSCDGQC